MTGVMQSLFFELVSLPTTRGLLGLFFILLAASCQDRVVVSFAEVLFARNLDKSQVLPAIELVPINQIGSTHDESPAWLLCLEDSAAQLLDNLTTWLYGCGKLLLGAQYYMEASLSHDASDAATWIFASVFLGNGISGCST
jgi:hypothetical protein